MDENEKRYRDLQRFVLSQRFDANETMFLERELTQLRAKIYQVEYPALKARAFAPKATDIASSAETYSYKVYELVGAVGHKGYKADDHPKIDVVSREVVGKVRPITGYYDWDLNELREASRNGTSLSDVKGKAARDFVERGIDQTLAFGAIPDQTGSVPGLGCTGLANNTDVEGGGGSRILSGSFVSTASDPADMLADLNTLAAKPRQDSKEAFDADTVLLPLVNYDIVAQTPYSDLDGTSVLEVFKKNNPNIKTVAPWHALEGAGASSKHRGIAYKKDSSVLEAIIPQEFEVLPPEARNYKLLLHVHARCGGVKIYYPVAMRYMDFALS